MDEDDFHKTISNLENEILLVPVIKTIENLRKKVGEGLPFNETKKMISSFVDSLPLSHKKRYLYMTRCYEDKEEWRGIFGDMFEILQKDKSKFDDYSALRTFLVAFTYFVGKHFNQVLLRTIHVSLFGENYVGEIPYTRRKLLFHFYQLKTPSEWFGDLSVFPLICKVLDLNFELSKASDSIYLNRIKESAIMRITLKSIESRVKQIGGGPIYEAELYESLVGEKYPIPEDKVKLKWLEKDFRKIRRAEMLKKFFHEYYTKFEKEDDELKTADDNSFSTKFSELNPQESLKLSISEEMIARGIPYHIFLEIIKYQMGYFDNFTFKITKQGILKIDSCGITKEKNMLLKTRTNQFTPIRKQGDLMKIWFGKVGSKMYKRIALIFPMACIVFEDLGTKHILPLPKNILHLSIIGSLSDYSLTNKGFNNLKYFPQYTRNLSISLLESASGDYEKLMTILKQTKSKIRRITLRLKCIEHCDELFQIIRKKIEKNGRLQLDMIGPSLEFKYLNNLFSQPFPIKSFFLSNNPQDKMLYDFSEVSKHLFSGLTMLGVNGTFFKSEGSFLKILENPELRNIRKVDFSESSISFGFIIRVMNTLQNSLEIMRCCACKFGGTESLQIEKVSPTSLMENPFEIYPKLQKNEKLKTLIMEYANLSKTRIDILSRYLENLKGLNVYNFPFTRTIRTLDFLYFLRNIKFLKITVQNPQMCKVVVENAKSLKEVYLHFLRGETCDVLNYVWRNCSTALEILGVEKERFFLDDSSTLDKIPSGILEINYLRFTNIKRISLWNAAMEPSKIGECLQKCPNLVEIRIKGMM